MKKKKMMLSCIAIAYLVAVFCEVVFNINYALANTILTLVLGIYLLSTIAVEYKDNGIGSGTKGKIGFIVGSILGGLSTGFGAYWLFLFTMKR